LAKRRERKERKERKKKIGKIMTFKIERKHVVAFLRKI
jgi:hypothetical protein